MRKWCSFNDSFNLDRFKGLEFLLDFYPTLHLQSIDDTVDDLIIMCKKNGGTLG